MKHFCSISDAIRVGAVLRPQIRRNMMRNGGTCALGAAAEAIGLEEIESGCYSELIRLYPYLETTGILCPVLSGCSMGMQDPTLGRAITHLNDDHGWTREAIADWLEREEEKLGFVTLVENSTEVTTQEKALVTV